MKDFGSPQIQVLIRRSVLLIILAALLYRWFGNSLPHQMAEPVLFNNGLDLSYWLLWFTGFPGFITNYIPGLIFSSAMFGVIAVACFKPLKGYLFFALAVLFLLFIMTYNLYSGHHTHCALGLFLAALALSVVKPESFSLSWASLRMYTCFLYGSAFLWKLFRGSLWYPGQANAVVESNLTWYLQIQPASMLTGAYDLLLSQPTLLAVLYLFAMLLEGVFLIGFFTRKFDNLLFFAPIVLHSSTYFMADVMFFEILVLNLTFVSAGFWLKADEFINKLKNRNYASANHTTR